MNKINKTPAILQGNGLPKFKEITSSQIKEQIPHLIKDLHADFHSLENELMRKITSNIDLCWDELINPLYKIEEKLRWSWGTISHLNGVSNSPELREAYSSLQPQIVEFSNRIGQSQVLYKALINIQERSQELDRAQQRIIEAELLSMKNKGVGLQGKQKEMFNTNSQRLAELSTSFSNNILDATKEWNLLLTKKEEIDGLPFRNLEAMAEAAKRSKVLKDKIVGHPNPKEGPWLLGLDMPSYISFLTYANNRTLRETLYKAFVSRASKGKNNNEELIEEILLLRKQQSQLLGYTNWAELSLASKMAKNVTEVERLLEELRIAAMPVAIEEVNRLQSFAAKQCGQKEIEIAPWDISFWSEKLRQELLNLNQESLRPWFPLPQVLKGLFKLCERLFGISIESYKGDFQTWHQDVEFFYIFDADGTHIASFYLDPYTRPSSKRGGAWMDECLTKQNLENEDIVLPVAYLVCNQTPPTGKTPSLMSFEEVKTLFHEFGHGLQHMLTKVHYPKAAGINNVEWDAVELPSQFMENWCLDKKTIQEIAIHWETKEPLPKDELKKLQLNQTFNSGLATLRQIHFAFTDIKLHTHWENDKGITPEDLRRDIAKTTCVIQPIPEDNMLCGFSHIFAGGYSAGYYSYKWAEVLSADAFSAFEEVGLENENQIKAIGRHFRETVLSLGGSEDPSKIFESFRGRAASTKALIRHCGLKVSL